MSDQTPKQIPISRAKEAAQAIIEKIKKPSIGRIVAYVLAEGPNKGQDRPAVIVRVWSDTTVNLQVFTDGDNDGLPAVKWDTSVQLDPARALRTWHWPERV